MAPKYETSNSIVLSKKRKDPPILSNGQQNPGQGRAGKRVKTVDARSILSQTSDAALKNGELDIQSFLKAREFEIKALENAMHSSKKVLATRAFQEVPRDMRRRTASHNVKRVPKRLQKRAAKEMKDDNTPTVNPSKRKPKTSRGWIRAETAKKLGILAAKKRAKKAGSKDTSGEQNGVTTRAARPKIPKDKLSGQPLQMSKFRKRQIHKTWLPTHLWHAKRAKMTEPKHPLWRFSIPLTPTVKSYRPTHRATRARGAVAWDMSYMSTISLTGPEKSIQKVLEMVGIDREQVRDDKGEKWRAGKRSWSGWLSRQVGDQFLQISPATIIWRAPDSNPGEDTTRTVPKKRSIRQVFVRLHPSAFAEAWTELLRLSKMQQPPVCLEDLRFEIGSIEIAGPGSTEALLGILHPFTNDDGTIEQHATTFLELSGVTNPSSLPSNALLAFSVIDPRLRSPPQPSKTDNKEDPEAEFALLQTLATWPADAICPPATLFDREARFRATRLPARKSLNRRKALEPPGSYPSILPTDPPIPIMILASHMTGSSGPGSWTILAPWKCILPIWYTLMYYPLSSGGNPRLGGLDELRQLYFEQGLPWFPADYPGTKAGFAWETEQRATKKAEWERRPKGKRIEWSSLDLGAGRRGEIGLGWACEFEKYLPGKSGTQPASSGADDSQDNVQNKKNEDTEPPISQLSNKIFTSLLGSPDPIFQPNTITTVRLTFVTRGVATPCARIYHLPPSLSSDATTNSRLPMTLRQQWLSLIPPSSKKRTPKRKATDRTTRIPTKTPLPQRIRLLAQSLLETPPLKYPKEGPEENDGHPLVPDEEQLIGYVTTGSFNLAEGKGVAIGNLMVERVFYGANDTKEGNSRLCIIRNSGETFGRLAKWEPV